MNILYKRLIYHNLSRSVRQLKEVAFARKQSSSQITGDNVAGEIYDHLLKSVANDFEEQFDDYSQKFVNKV